MENLRTSNCFLLWVVLFLLLPADSSELVAFSIKWTQTSSLVTIRDKILGSDLSGDAFLSLIKQLIYTNLLKCQLNKHVLLPRPVRRLTKLAAKRRNIFFL